MSDWKVELKNITNNKGVTFSDFCRQAQAEKEAILHHTFKPQSDDPTLKDRDNAQTVAYIARVNYLQSKARSYAIRAKGTIVWNLIKDGEKVSVLSDLCKKWYGDFEEEASDWETLSDSLHERLWTGRGEMRRLNRGEG